ncbi:MAG: hypothetical protein HY719_17445 [Planctomycetes bacterium]|nr:hypothetical protein [Planctomycetota bacterium]
MAKVLVFLVSKDANEARLLAEAFNTLDIRMTWVQGRNTALARSLVDRPVLVIESVADNEPQPLELLTRFRAEETLRGAWFFLLCSKITRELAETAKAAGVTGLLVKPFEPMALIERIKKWTGINFLNSAIEDVRRWQDEKKTAPNGV